MESIPPDHRAERTSFPSVSATGPSVSATGDWPAQAADFVVNTVDAVRNRTTGTILTIARVTVFGLLAVVLGLVVAVLTIVLLVRLLDEILPSNVWLPYLVLGLASLIGGMLAFRRRHPSGTSKRS
jgi:vacuolar-type H+-ATPase subunit I/STV1